MQVGSKPLSQLKTGQVVRVVVLPQSHHFLLSMRPSAITAAESAADSSDFAKAVMKPLSVGEQLAGTVDEAMDDHLYIVTANDVRVRVHCLHASDDPSALACLPETLPVGSVVRGRLLEVETERKHVSMSLLPDTFAPLCKGGSSPKVRRLASILCPSSVQAKTCMTLLQNALPVFLFLLVPNHAILCCIACYKFDVPVPTINMPMLANVKHTVHI